ncbi:TonB-linked SusC/RagA family outer membrane protein [Pedobacter sp. AK017]|uniref:SusC/RagA family TonB-linked outer membrane protein n=1 Tax=Pedobacter sp. AK017 TaxID=2723073 RepID=UPI001621B29C|nr:SusC/RagA family TonB-linked outer membrane protein [Pedobacter sp. AK017]MBB5441076.1 TonB-linked SusC/RagA family outer membrane protein [Pedobacter sp. AK017]
MNKNYPKTGYALRHIHKILLIMRLTTVILIFSIMQVSATTFAQKISLSEKQTPLSKVFKKISQQSGYDFLVAASMLKGTKPVTIDIQGAELDVVLTAIFKDQPISYTINDKVVTVTRKEEPSFFERVSARFQAIDVRGRVVDPEGNALSGATVAVKGGGKSTSTNSNGEFYLARINDDAMLIISFMGYITKEVKVKAELGNIQLELSHSKLDEIQIIAYGQVQKKYSTSNIHGIKASDIAKQPINNPLLALSGRVPGLFIQQTGGVSGAPVNITVQGNNSMANSNDPFFVIDGIPFTSKNIATGLQGTSQPGTTGSTFSYINPADIESIEILKDADATAIYGSRASNGAILITTKKGKAGKTVVDVNSHAGWGKITRKVKVMNTAQYLETRNEAFKNANIVPSSANYDVNGVYDLNKNTDWQDELVGGTAKLTNIQTSISGGSANTQFLAGGGYINETTVYPGKLGDTKASFHFNVNHVSTNQRFKFNFSGSYLQDNNKLATTDLMSPAVSLVPNAPGLYNSDGSINWGQLPNNPTTYTFTANPIAFLFKSYNAKTNNLIGSSLIGYEIFPGLELKSTLGYNKINTDEISILPLNSIRPDQLSFIGREGNYANKFIESYIVEPQLTFSRKVFYGHVEALLGATFQNNESFVENLKGRGYTTDEQISSLSAATTITGGSSKARYKYTAIFGRLNYRLYDKYILNLTARRDGSSRFGSENLFNYFYSLGAAWLFGSEKLIKDNLPFINFGKLRGTYGTSGNDQIGDYGYLNLYEPYSFDIPYQNQIGLIPSGHANPFLQWEETKKINLGLDLQFLDNKFGFTANYFQNRSSNQLLRDPTPVYTGFANFRRNLPATVQNTGWEFLFDLSPLKVSKVTWNTSLNLTIPRNKLIAYPNLASSSNANRYVIGEPYNIIKVYRYIGVNAQTGLYEFMDAKGNATSTPSNPVDKIALIDLNPRFYGGVNNSFGFNGFNLSFLFQFTKQNGVNNKFGNYPGINAINQPTTILTRWKSPGDITDIQKLSSTTAQVFSPQTAVMASDAAYGDASYIRLKNVSLSYSLPNNIIKAAKISSLRFYLQGQNLLTITKLLTDPESQLLSSLPPLRFYTAGIQLTL